MTAPALAPGLQRKLKKVLEIRTETPEVVNSLATLSEFYDKNNATTRRQLRSTIENRGVGINESFLKVAEDVMAALDMLQADLDAVSANCDKMTESVANSKAVTTDLLHDTERLQRALAVSETRSQLVGKFLEQYQLSPGEAEALQTDEVTEAFFQALDHVRIIHANCKSLLRTHHQRAGLELMDAMGTLQEGAYERLCRWVQAECRGLSEGDAPDVNPLLQRAAATLRERHVLFRYCTEEVAAARHTALFQRFIKALTRGPRPIEMHAPDPMRYVNDMLAWVHTSLASEREILVALFGEDPAPKPEAEIDAGDDSGDVLTLVQLLDSIFESICRPLKVRIEQVLMSTPPPLLCFRLSQLLTFYLKTVDGMLGANSQLSDALRACRSMAIRTYHEHLKQRGDKLARYPPAPPSSLSPSPQLLEGSTLLTGLVDAFETSIYPEGASGEQDFDTILAAVTEPLLEMCYRSSEALNPTASSRVDEGSHLDPSDQKVYLLNCMHALQAPLSGHACAAERAGRVGRAIEGTVADLVKTEVSRVLASCGLAEVSERLTMYSKGREAAIPGFSEGVPADDSALELNKVADALRTFFGRLSDPAVIPELPKLQVPLLKASASRQIGRGLAEAYASVYNALMDPASGYDQRQVVAAVKHTPAQVKTLLGVDIN